MLLTITYGGRNCTKLVLKTLGSYKRPLCQSCLLQLPSRLYYFRVHDGYPLLLHTRRSIADYIAMLPLIN